MNSKFISLPALSRSDQPVNQSVTNSPSYSVCQSISQSLTHSLSLSICHSLTHSICQCISQSVTKSVNPSVSHSVCQSIIQSFTPSVTQSVCQSVTQSTDPSIRSKRNGRSLTRSTVEAMRGMSLRTQVGLANQCRQTVTSQRGAALIFLPLWYRFVTTTAIITDTDVIVITIHRYTPAKWRRLWVRIHQ